MKTKPQSGTVVIGKVPLESLIAEFKATLPTYRFGPPDGAGWVESVELAAALGLGRSTFQRFAQKNLAGGVWEREIGSKLGAHGKPVGTYYFRVRKPATK